MSSAMKKREKFAIQAVLIHIDAHPLENTTFVARLRCLEEIHAKLPQNVRQEVFDIYKIYSRLQRVLEHPNNLRNDVVIRDAPPMQQLFAQGRGMLSQTYLDHIEERSSLFSQRAANSDAGHDHATQDLNSKRKAASHDPEDSDWPAAKSAKIGNMATPDRTFANDDSIQNISTDLLAERLLDEMATSAPNSIPSPTVYQSEDEDLDHPAMRHGFRETDGLVRAVPLRVYGNEQGSRTATLTTKPDPDLQILYEIALGDPNWKPIAIELQSIDALAAEDLLQCIIWAFLDLNVFASKHIGRGVGDPAKLVGGSVFVRREIDNAGADGESVLRDAAARLLDDPTFCGAVIDLHANVLARKLLLLLESHLQHSLERRAVAALMKMLRTICRASLALKVRVETLTLGYWLRWHTKGKSFVEADMKRLPNQHGSMVAFTLAPGLLRGDGPMHVVECPARVNTFDS